MRGPIEVGAVCPLWAWRPIHPREYLRKEKGKTLVLSVNCAVTAGESGLAYCFGPGGVGVAGEGKILGGGPKFHGDADFVDKFAGGGADDVGTKDAVGVFVGEDFDETVALKYRLGAGIAHEGEFADFVGMTGVLERLFGSTDRCDFG